MKCERGGNCGICNFRFSTEVLLAPPLLLDHIDPSRSVRVCECLCFPVCESHLSSWESAMLFCIDTERGSRAEL